MFLEECKFVVKEKKMPEYITDNTEVSYDDSTLKDFDEEISYEKDSDEENCNEGNYVSNIE